MRIFISALELILLMPSLVAQVGQVTTQTDGGGLITLYSHDSLAHTLCFRDGLYGLVVNEGQVKNRCSDLDFDNYNAGNFSSGVEGASKAAILDLGTEDDLKTKYLYEQTYGVTQGFSSIELKNLKFYIRKGNGQALQEMSGIQFGNLESVAKAVVRTGHIYLLHIAHGNDAAFNVWVKFLVVSYVQGDYVTLRWQLLNFHLKAD